VGVGEGACLVKKTRETGEGGRDLGLTEVLFCFARIVLRNEGDQKFHEKKEGGRRDLQ